MERKSGQFFLELFLTFLLLVLVISLFGERLSGYRVYLILGLISGICFSWFTRNKGNKIIRFVINVGILGSLFWVIYSILNSSFIYREAILIWVKGILILEVLFTFNIYRYSFLTYIQLLTIPLFMAQAIFIKHSYNDSSIILMFGYLIAWLVILKLKFYESLDLYSKNNEKKNYSFSLSMVFFLIVVIVSGILFYKVPLIKIKTGGIFQEAGPDGEKNEFNKEFSQKEYYDLQDKIQEEITKLIPELNSSQAKYEVLGLLSLLIKESPCAMEADKGELGLISYLKQPGPGLEEKTTEEGLTIPKQPRTGSEKNKEELSAAVKNYMDQKTALNLDQNKNSIMDIFKKNPFNIKEKISFLNRVNKIQQGNSYESISKAEQEAKKNVGKSSLENNVKMALREHIRQFKEWKTFEIYRKALEKLEKNMHSLKEMKKEFIDSALELKRIENLADFKALDNQLRELKEITEPQSKNLNNLVKDLKKISDLKLEMFLAKKSSDLKEKLESAKLSQYKKIELKEQVEEMQDAGNPQNLLRNEKEFKKKIEGEKADVSPELKELLDTKIHQIAKEKKEKIEQLLKESLLSSEQKKDFLKDVEKLEGALDSEKLTAESRKLEDSIDKFVKQGLISKKTEDNLSKEIGELKSLFASRERPKEDGLSQQTESQQLDVLKEWEGVLEKSSLGEVHKEELKRLSEESDMAGSLSELDLLKKEAEKKLESLSKEGLKKEQIEKLEGLLESQIAVQEKALRKSSEQNDSQKKWKEAVEESSLKSETKEELERLSEEISKADSLSKLDLLKKEAEKKLESLSREGLKKEQIEKLEDLLESQIAVQEKALRKSSEQNDSQKKWKEAVEESSLKSETKEEFERLSEEISKADSLSELGLLEQDAKKKLESLSMEGMTEQQIEQLQEVLEVWIDAQENALREDLEQSDSQQKWEETIEGSVLGEDDKEALRRSIERLSRANTVSELQDVKQAIEKEINSLSQEKIREQAEQLKESFDSVIEMKRIDSLEENFYGLRKNIDKLRETDPQGSRILEEHLRKLRNAAEEKDFKKKLDDLQEYLNSKESKTPEKQITERRTGSWQLYIMPSYIVMPVNTSLSLHTVAVYDKTFINDLSTELEWISSDPNIAWVDKKGVVRSLSNGQAKINVRFRGEIIEGAEIVVTDKISEEINKEIKKDLRDIEFRKDKGSFAPRAMRWLIPGKYVV